MTQELTTEEKHAILKTLAGEAIERLKTLPQPVVRVSGPLTSGGFGYEENLRRFIVAQRKLREQGLTVFDYFEGNHDEQQIVPLGLSWKEVMVHYHRPIMATGLLRTVFMMPRWEESHGATDEYEFSKELNLEVKDIPQDWF